mgnify:CR=1 FL=1
MILKKPYAFFIKHFKLFNIILTVLEIYALYKVGFLFQFFSEYSSYPQGAIGQNLIGTLINNYLFIDIVVIIIGSLVLAGILHIKNKPIKLYVFNIIINIFIVVLLLLTTNILSTIQVQIIDNRTAFVYRDFLAIAGILELIIIIFTCIRALGFDIKSFSFGKDLEEMHIETSDNEEFELQIDVDSGGFKRNLNKNKRFLKYFIYENKFAIILVATIVLAITSFLVYSRMGIYFNAIKPNKMIDVDNFILGTSGSYLTNQDYKGNTILNDKVLIGVNIKIKTNTNKEKMNIARFSLVIDNKRYYHTTNYKDKLIDLGVTYNNQVITNDFENYLLVFEISKNKASKKMYLLYDTNDEKNVKFKLNITNLDTNDTIETKTINLGETLTFNNSLIKDGELTITNFEIKNKFKLDYKFCVTDNECYDSYEYIAPNFKNNYDKTVLKLVGNINFKDSSINTKSLYDFINNYGTIGYTLYGQNKKQMISFAEINPSKTNTKNVYYIEILDEIKSAQSIYFEFKIRNIKYIYKLK